MLRGQGGSSRKSGNGEVSDGDVASRSLPLANLRNRQIAVPGLVPSPIWISLIGPLIGSQILAFCASLDDPRRHARSCHKLSARLLSCQLSDSSAHAIASVRDQLKPLSIQHVDPEKRLLHHIIIGCTAVCPSRLITIYQPPIDVCHEPAQTTIPAGAVFLWRVDSTTKRIKYDNVKVLFAHLHEMADLPILNAHSSWSMARNCIVQVLHRCDNDDNAGEPGLPAQGRETIEFRISSAEIVLASAGIGEFADINSTHVCFDQFDRFGVTAVGLKTRLFLYYAQDACARPRLAGNVRKCWRLIPQCDVVYQSFVEHAALYVVEVDAILSSAFEQRILNSAGCKRRRDECQFTDFAICSLHARADGFVFAIGGLQADSAIFVTCVVMLNLVKSSIKVLKLYQADTSNIGYKNSDGQKNSMFSASVLLRVAIRGMGMLNFTSHGVLHHQNMKPLAAYYHDHPSINKLDLAELGMVIK
ncbi:hypothetical protein V1514DRAFT_320601 [Lipomyces japonicus]|uniref:uncharacterized protein n=1 Tax=Lipomyces japonicus TaxID=56871 RepID=UPI0034CF459F